MEETIKEENLQAKKYPVDLLVMPGDKFKYNIPLMQENNIAMPSSEDSDKIHEASRVDYYKGLGHIITYETTPLAQVNRCWVIKA